MSSEVRAGDTVTLTSLVYRFKGVLELADHRLSVGTPYRVAKIFTKGEYRGNALLWRGLPGDPYAALDGMIVVKRGER